MGDGGDGSHMYEAVACGDHNDDVRGAMRMDGGGDSSHMESSTKLWFVVIIWRSIISIIQGCFRLWV